ncbi:hypothetical protein [uncultured Maritimibacter sp.]|nr:hypothetical protein [uncultured Maritimibacter sp.]
MCANPRVVNGVPEGGGAMPRRSRRQWSKVNMTRSDDCPVIVARKAPEE